MKELLIGVGTFTNTSSLFGTEGLKFVTMNELKFVSAILSFLNFFSLNDSTSKTTKNAFYFI